MELFPCSGGMALGFHRAGIKVQQAYDYDAAACDSYEANLGHRPVQIDARDLLRMVEHGWSPGPVVDLFIADPPCTPWSRAGKRLGTEDERDMLVVTIELVKLLKPRAALIANVPGLDDGPNWPIVQRVIGGLTAHGYCIDFARLDAADWGVPQHRVRPFWFAHRKWIPHVVWPERTHASPQECAQPVLPGMIPLRPWVTCRQALSHLSAEDMGKPIRLRWRGHNVPDRVLDKPARIVGSINGNAMLFAEEETVRVPHAPSKKPRATPVDDVAGVVTASSNGNGGVVYDPEILGRVRGDGSVREHEADAPAHTIRGGRSSSERLLLEGPNHRPSRADRPARTLTRNPMSDGALLVVPHHPISPDSDGLSRTLVGGSGTTASKIMAWPWDAPATTVTGGGRLPPPGHHPESGSFLSMPGAVKLSEKAAAILQGFPPEWRFIAKTKAARWSMLGQAMPAPLAEAVGHAISRALRAGEIT